MNQIVKTNFREPKLLIRRSQTVLQALYELKVILKPLASLQTDSSVAGYSL